MMMRMSRLYPIREHHALIAAARGSPWQRLACTSSLLLLALGAPLTLRAQVCQVPAQFPRISTAVANPACSQVNVASGTYVDYIVLSRNITIVGAGTQQTTISGAIQVTGSAVVELSELTARATCRPALEVASGASALTTNMQVEFVGGATGPDCLLFSDGFES